MGKIFRSRNLLILASFLLVYDLLLFLDFKPLNNIEQTFSWEIYGLNLLDSKVLRRQLPVKPDKSYSIALIGDSMTDFLRSGENQFKKDLGGFYNGKNFIIYNYGFGSTNILSLDERIHKNTDYKGQTYKALLGENYNLIIIESFGNNPLTQFPLSEGLKKQTEELDKIISQIKKAHPQSLVVFMSTIAPTKSHYAEGVIDLDTKTRERWAAERESYIQNHIRYAKSHNIPLIDLYDKTVDKNGEGDLSLINSADHIHPSSKGVSYINSQLASYIYSMRLLPL